MPEKEAMLPGREINLLRPMAGTTWKFYAWVGFLIAGCLWGLVAYVVQLRYGLIVTGMRDQVSWGVYIINFVFFISISIAGTLISAVLRLTHARWRRPITRMAEAITLAALLVAAPLVVVDMGRPERALNLIRFGRVQSPIFWDFLSVSTYLVACLIFFYLPLIPDVAILAPRTEIPAWRRRLYQILSMGWKGQKNQHHLLEVCITIMAVAVLPLAVSTHTVLAWIFSTTLRPGWNSSIFGPYFVIGAIYSGCACVILAMYVLRRVLHLEDYIHTSHFRNLGLLFLTFCLLYLYFNLNELITAGYKFETADKMLLQRLLAGDDAPLFWSVQILGLFVPICLLATVLTWKTFQEFTIPGVALSSALVVVAAWAKRYLIVVPTLQSPYLPVYQGVPWEWVHYHITWVEWSLTAASFAEFLLIFTILTKLFPPISIWETREGEWEAEPVEKGFEGAAPAIQARAHRAPPIGIVLIASVLIGAVSAQAQQSPKDKKLKPTALSLEWQVLPPSGKPAASPAGGENSSISTSRRVFEYGKEILWPPSARTAEGDERPAIPVQIVATLHDENGAPLAYRAVGFALKTTFGTLLQFGKFPTDDQGRARLVIHDRRCGVFPFQAVYSGDPASAVSFAETKVDFGACPPLALPTVGVLITPYATAPITITFIFFYGQIWLAFLYVGYLLFWRIRRSGQSSGDHALPHTPAS